MDPDSQKLIFKGAITSNEKQLLEYGLQENDFMVLMTSKVYIFITSNSSKTFYFIKKTNNPLSSSKPAENQ